MANSSASTENNLDIAIVGMAGRFPGSSDLGEFWSNLVRGIESVTPCTEREVIDSGFHPEIARDSDFIAVAGKLEGEYTFDADFFGIAPREAEIMDPQHRVMLECAWHALEAAGYNPETCPARIGVYAGASTNTYFPFHIASNHRLLSSVGLLQAITANDKDFLSSRISYKLNLKGPAISVQTACSTSLVAVNLGCMALLNYQCDMVLAGGVSVTPKGRLYKDGFIFAKDGHCRPFDEAAQGAVFGNGVGIVVLKRLEDALADGDHIHAVIKSSVTNNDGSLKAGYTAPSVTGQKEAISESLALAGISPTTIQYIEAHGTGTALGDPIEIAALTQAFREHTGKKAFCAVGSIKGNIGHLDAAAGIAGLIKTVMALERRQIPPTLHFHKANPHLNLEDSPFFINAALCSWPDTESPRRAAVSSFGFGGTNAHAILEEAPSRLLSSDAGPEWQLLPISARTDASLQAAAQNLTAFCRTHPQANLADVAFTLQMGRKHFSRRTFAVVKNYADPAGILADFSTLLSTEGNERERNSRVVFMFPGETRFSGMGRGIDEWEPVFWENMRRCAQLASRHIHRDLIELIYPRPGLAESEALPSAYNAPALFAFEYSLACLWKSWGIHPAAMIGEGVGEYVAACLAGVFSLEDAIKLVCACSCAPQAPGAATVHLSTAFDGVQFSSPQIPYIASVTGDWATTAQVHAPAYWIKLHLGPVRIQESLETLASADDMTLLQLGPGERLLTLARHHAGNIDCLENGVSRAQNLTCLGQLWIRGARVEWNALHHGRARRRMPLPGYEFRRKLYFVPPTYSSPSASDAEMADPASEMMGQASVAPCPSLSGKDQLERVIAGVWQKILGVEAIGHEDDFFMLGGHSLMAIQLLAETRRCAGADVPVEVLFEEPTISAMARYIRGSKQKSPADHEPLMLDPAPRDGELPLTFHQEDVWRFETALPGTARYTGVISMTMTGDLVHFGLEFALNEILKRHEVLRTTYQANAAGRPVAIIHPAERFDLPVTDISHLKKEAVQQEVLRAANSLVRAPFDLSRDRFIRPLLFRISATQHTLLFCSHYVAVDAWTVGLLAREISEHYAAYMESRPARLPEAAVQCVDAARRQRDRCTDEFMKPHLDYWRRQLEEVAPQELVPLDRPRPQSNTMCGSTLHFSLTPELTRALKHFSHRHGSTLFFTLVSALNVLFHARSGSRDIVIGTITGDREPGMEAVFGSFVNCLPLRNQIGAHQSFLDVMESVRNCVTDAYAHQAPFQKIAEALGTDRELIDHPLFRVLLVLRNVPFTEMAAAGLQLRLSHLLVNRGVSEGDLSIYLQEFAGALSGYFEYNHQIFDASTIQRLSEDFANFLDILPRSPETRLCDLKASPEPKIQAPPLAA